MPRSTRPLIDRIALVFDFDLIPGPLRTEAGLGLAVGLWVDRPRLLRRARRCAGS